MPEETKKTSPVVAELKRLKEKLNSLKLEKKEKPEIKEKIEEKIEETKEKIEEVKKRKGNYQGWKKYWEEVRVGKRKTPWEIHKERMKEKEKQKKEEAKPENKTLDKETEKIKEKLEKIPETEFLKSKEINKEAKEEKSKEGFDLKKFFQKNDTWILVLGIVIIIWVGIKFLNGRGSSSNQSISGNKKEKEPIIEWEEINIAPPGAPPRIIRRLR